MIYLSPTRIVKQEGNIESVSAFFNEKRLQIGLQERDNIVVRGKAYFILDFGKELSGGVRILTFSRQSKYYRVHKNRR